MVEWVVMMPPWFDTTQVAEHARNDHGMKDVPPEVVAKVRAHIKDVA